MKNTMRKVGAFAFVALVFFSASPVMAGGNDKLSPAHDQVTVLTKKGEKLFFDVEVAMSPHQQEQGLMNRTALDLGAGMLFVFNEVEKRAFWMKDTLIPLDMLFIAKDGTIHHIHHQARPLDEARITSERPVKAVLEINGGQSDKLGITEGDKVLHPVFRNILAD